MSNKTKSRDIPVFKKPIECRLALQMGGRILKFDAANVMSGKMKWARDLKTFIGSFKSALQGQEFSPEFEEFINEVETSVDSVFARVNSISGVRAAAYWKLKNNYMK